MFDNISWLLGYYLDGWADLIEGMGAKAAAVHSGVIDQLNQREMPDIEVGETDVQEGFFSDLHRSYVTTKTYPEARTLIYIEKHGKDLYTSWRSFIRPSINWRLIGTYAIVALFMSLFYGFILFILFMLSIGNQILSAWNARPFFSAFLNWILVGVGIAFALLFLIGMVVRISRKHNLQVSWSLFIILLLVGLLISMYIKGAGKDMLDEIGSLNSTMTSSMVFFFLPFSIPMAGLNIFIVILIFAAIAGLIIRKNLLAFILKEASIFDADDITAMNLSVHKSILHVLDEQGIDISKLRLKRDFKGGRSGEVV